MAADGNKKREQGEEIRNELPPQWKPKQGDVVEGFYRGWKEIHPAVATAPFRIHVLQLDEDAELPIKQPDSDESKTEIIEAEETISVSGKILDRLMARVPNDAYVWIAYRGKEKVGKGKAHSYKVTLAKGVQPLPEALDSDKLNQANA